MMFFICHNLFLYVIIFILLFSFLNLKVKADIIYVLDIFHFRNSRICSLALVRQYCIWLVAEINLEIAKFLDALSLIGAVKHALITYY